MSFELLDQRMNMRWHYAPGGERVSFSVAMKQAALHCMRVQVIAEEARAVADIEFAVGPPRALDGVFDIWRG